MNTLNAITTINTVKIMQGSNLDAPENFIML